MSHCADQNQDQNQNRCFFCSTEVPEECPQCWSGHVRVGTLEFVWNGYVAKRVDVAWCHNCDAVWVVGADGQRVYVCRDCRARALAVNLGGSQPAIEQNQPLEGVAADAA
jgi:hypothetical protein